ncbi:MAG: HAMP domain-containing histidine kinase [Lachnospiraceae bacterium]|nr:HAMP domain-containing histidine kinase [Lachnospiraceae bacterium]
MEKKSFDLKNRVVMSFLVLTITPVILTAIITVVTLRMQTNKAHQQYGVEASFESLYDNARMLSEMVNDVYQEIEEVAKENPEQLEDKAYLNQLNEKLRRKRGFLAVRKERQIFYNGATSISDPVLLEGLPPYGDSAETDFSLMLGSNGRYLVRKIDVRFEDAAKGSIFLIVNRNQLNPTMKSWLFTMILMIILLLILTSSLVSFWIYRSVIAPVNSLKQAAREIRDGNLDFSVQKSGLAEMDDLCSDFEEMRLRLKESAEEKMKNDQDSKELISNISHDLKTPITAVKGYCEGIIDGVADTPEKMDRYIRTIYNKTIEMDRLINELTLYSKINTNKIPYTFTKIHINEYFADCVEDLKLELQAKQVEFASFDYLTEDCIVIADAEQLSRVINNIISNAVKYMNKPKKLINMRLRDVGDFVQLEIEDNGKGIAQKDLPQIFERFYRTDASRNSARGGSGIGLSIVRKIVEDHGGKVWATSKEDVGTTMFVVLRKYQEVTIDAEQSEDTDHRGRRNDSGAGEGLSGAVGVRGRNRNQRGSGSKKSKGRRV